MGRPKSLLALAGETFVERVIAAMRSRVEQLVLLGDGPMPPAGEGLTRLPDVPGVAGPLAGILAAMHSEPHAGWLIVACDLPKLRPEALDWLLSERSADHWAVLPMVQPGRAEPLLAVYEPEARILIERRVRLGVMAPSDLAGEPRVHSPTPPAALCECWANINTPQQYRRLCENGGLPPSQRPCPRSDGPRGDSK